jgi:ADP-ribosyl-[dinitrogen reductase] hydrolase
MGLDPPPSVNATEVGLVPNPAVDYRDKYRGSLIGGAIGDALGRPVEGWSPSEVRQRFGVLRDYSAWWGWAGGPKGTVTDDTQLTMELAQCFLDSGCFDPKDFAGRLVRWLPHGRGKGRATVEAVEKLQDGTPWFRSGTRSAGNGAAMRAAPVGLCHAVNPEGLRLDAAASAVVTHSDPMAVVSTVAQAFGVAFLTHQTPGDLEIDRFFESLHTMIADLADPGARERRPSAGAERVRLADRLQEIRGMLGLEPREAFRRLYNGAFVLESLPAAVWTFLKTPDDPETVLVTAINAGRDADTVAAMAGNLVGAYLGESVLPERWLADLEFSVELRDQADGLLHLAGLD